MSVIFFRISVSLISSKHFWSVKLQNNLDWIVVIYTVYVSAKVIINPLSPWHSEHTITSLLLCVAYFYFKSCLKNKAQTNALITSLQLIGLGQVFYGLLQFYGYLPSFHSLYPVTGSFFNPAPYAGFLISVLPVALSRSFNENRRNVSGNSLLVQYIARITAIGILLMLPLTQSRAAWIAAIVGILIVSEDHFNLTYQVKSILNNQLRKVLFMAAALATVTAVSLWLFSIRSASVYGRWLNWKVTWLVIRDHLLWGVGTEQYRAVFGQCQANYFKDHPNDMLSLFAGEGEYIFNVFLDTAVKQGFVGLSLFIGIIIFALKAAFRSSNKTSRSIGFSIISILIFGLFSYPFSVLPIQINFFFFIAYCSVQQHESEVSNLRTNPKVSLALCTIIIIFSSLVSYYELERYRAYKVWKQASDNKLFFAYREAISSYEQAYSVLKYDGEFLLHYGHTLQFYGQCQKSIDVLKEATKRTTDVDLFISLGKCHVNLKEYDEAERNFKFASHLNPHLLYPLYLIAKLYEERGEISKAVSTAKDLLSRDAKIPSETAVVIKEEMQILINKYEQ